jgi:hypothetical protein
MEKFIRSSDPKIALNIGFTYDKAKEMFREEWESFQTKFQEDAAGLGASVLYTDVEDGEEPIEASYYWDEEEKEWTPECMSYNLF